MNGTDNPFSISGYEGPERFCDREEETARITNAIRNKRNLVILAQRRMGKTVLIEHAFHQVKNVKGLKTFSVDLLPCENLNDFCLVMAREVVALLESKPEKLIKTIRGMFRTLNPIIRYDAVTGDPAVEFQLGDKSSPQLTLTEIFRFLESLKIRMVIAFDEFQQIAFFPEKNTQSLLRAEIQKCKYLSFIFSGSRQHLLGAMFAQHNKPFYQSAEIMQLEKISEEAYSAFILNHFKKNKFSISVPAIHLGLQKTKRHTWYVQYLFHKLYANGKKQITEKEVEHAFKTILKEQEAIYTGYRNLLTKNQWNLLIGLAKEGEVGKPLSKEFIRKYELGTSSSVQVSLKRLNEQEMIYFDENTWKIYDLYFSEWLSSWIQPSV
ncbi:MAG TPA: hypothetical protein PLR45_07350 [Flavobacteriales bacterium]|nr:hypothetical protein [Flavobacteriales bacterium]